MKKMRKIRAMFQAPLEPWSFSFHISEFRTLFGGKNPGNRSLSLSTFVAIIKPRSAWRAMSILVVNGLSLMECNLNI